MNRMLGRLARRHDKPTVHLADYLDAPRGTSPLSVDPPQVDDWGMLLNDQLGCCTCSAVGHLIDAWNADEKTNRICPRDDDVLALYRMVTGGEDAGAQCIDVLDAWRMMGMAGDKVTAYVEVDPRRREHVRLSVWQLGGLYCGVTLPKGTMEQTDAGQPWSLDGVDLDDPLGGHCVPIVGYDADGLTCVTWGKLQRMTWHWFAACCDESFAVWDSQDWFGDVPGLDAQGLIAALQRLNDAG